MQNLTRYFGIKARVNEVLDPMRVEILRERARNIFALHNFNEDEYFVYFNSLEIEMDRTHFGFAGGIKKRVEKIEFSFSVNPKQNRRERIKLYNFLLMEDDGDQAANPRLTGGAQSVTYHLSGEYLDVNLGFKSEIITFISKKLRPAHRKLKVSLTAFSTQRYEKFLHKKLDYHVTKIDFKFKKPIRLNVPMLDASQTPVRRNSVNLKNRKVGSNMKKLTRQTIFGLDEIFKDESASVIILFCDIVGFSTELTARQVVLFKQLREILKAQLVSANFNRAFVISTGDGAAIIIDDSRSKDIVLKFCRDFAEKNQGTHGIRIRIGVHYGTLSIIEFNDGTFNAIGHSINMAARIMDVGDDKHILVSDSFYKAFVVNGAYQNSVHLLGKIQIKHGETIELYNFHEGNAGNNKIPIKMHPPTPIA